MSTPKQNEANRQNAQKSTGPRSPEGKAASRFNALKSGIDAKSQVIPGEDPDQLEVLVAEYQERFSTATPERRLLVDTLVNSEWLLRRLNRAEAEFWQYEAHRTESEYSSNAHPIGRNYHRALKELQSLEAAEQPVECPSGAGLQACPVTTPEHSDPSATEVPAPSPSQSNQQPGPQIGFVPPIPVPERFSPPFPSQDHAVRAPHAAGFRIL
jgi:hypothetical protein